VHLIVSFSPLLFAVTQFVTSKKQVDSQSKLSDNSDATAATLVALLALKRQLGLTRRFFRTFRFLDAFNSAYNLAQAQDWGSLSVVMILDIMARSFNGMYLLLETATLIEAMEIKGLAVWSLEYETLLKIESQRSWFLALMSGGISCAVVLYRDQTERVSLTVLLQGEKSNSADTAEKSEGSDPSPNRGIAASKQEKISRRLVELDRRSIVLARKLTANCLDLALPGSVIGWVPASSGQVGACMFVTSLLTGYDVWERCGREVRGAV
jgi:hypothetical protein